MGIIVCGLWRLSFCGNTSRVKVPIQGRECQWVVATPKLRWIWNNRRTNGDELLFYFWWWILAYIMLYNTIQFVTWWYATGKDGDDPNDATQTTSRHIAIHLSPLSQRVLSWRKGLQSVFLHTRQIKDALFLALVHYSQSPMWFCFRA